MICPPWLSPMLAHPLRRILQNPEKILGGLVREGQTAADLGCGPGFFTIPMARMVGESGRVIAADRQGRMLDYVRRRAEKAGLGDRVRTHQCREDSLGIDESLDFALAMFMAHELPRIDRFMQEVEAIMKPEGDFLLAEPIMHVSAARFQETVRAARDAGLKAVAEPRIGISRAVLLRKG